MVPLAEKYSHFAPLYDLLSGEYPVYRAGRTLGVGSLDLQPGAQVLDVGCGTGLNFGLLHDGVGKTGTIIGVDRSRAMLARARRRAQRRGWTNIILIEADATTFDVGCVQDTIIDQGGRAASDAALATYALSLMTPWQAAWERMLQLTGPGATLSVVDMQEPTGRFSVLTPLARAACRLGGADITAHPWQAVERDCGDVRAFSARGNHLQVRTGHHRPDTRRDGARSL